MSTETLKVPDESLRLNETGRNMVAGADAMAVQSQIRLLKTENETLRREKNEIEQKAREQVITLEVQLQDEKELRESIEQKCKKYEETSRKEKKEKMDLMIELQCEKDEKNEAIERMNEVEKKLQEKDKDKRKVEQMLQYETEEKKEAVEKADEEERIKKSEIEKRR
ncbi:MAG: hypothetical protein EZS28_036907, partial [Streblomastix strix]